jgi:hypothetical protein
MSVEKGDRSRVASPTRTEIWRFAEREGAQSGVTEANDAVDGDRVELRRRAGGRSFDAPGSGAWTDDDSAGDVCKVAVDGEAGRMGGIRGIGEGVEEPD